MIVMVVHRIITVHCVYRVHMHAVRQTRVLTLHSSTSHNFPFSKLFEVQDKVFKVSEAYAPVFGGIWAYEHCLRAVARCLFPPGH